MLDENREHERRPDDIAHEPQDDAPPSSSDEDVSPVDDRGEIGGTGDTRDTGETELPPLPSDEGTEGIGHGAAGNVATTGEEFVTIG